MADLSVVNVPMRMQLLPWVRLFSPFYFDYFLRFFKLLVFYLIDVFDQEADQ